MSDCFVELQKVLVELLDNGIYASYETSLRRNNIQEDIIQHEEKIQASLTYFSEIAIDEVVIQHAEQVLRCTQNSKVKLRYLLFLCKHTKTKYQYAKDLVQVAIIENAIDSVKNDEFFFIQLYKAILNYSSQMKIEVTKVWEKTYAAVTNDLSLLPVFVQELFYFVAKTNTVPVLISASTKLQTLLEDSEKHLRESGNFNLLEMVYQRLLEISDKSIQKELIRQKLATIYLNQAQLNQSPVAQIHFAQKAAALFKMNNDKENKTKSLSIIQTAVKAEHPDWKKVFRPLSKKQNEVFETIILQVKEVFSNIDTPFEERVQNLGKYIVIAIIQDGKNVAENIVYQPFPFLESINEMATEFSSSIVRQILTPMTLADDKVVAIGNDALIQAKSLSFSIHVSTNILPAINSLEESEDYSQEEIVSFLQSSQVITTDDMIFIKEALEDYKNERYISFIAVLVPCIECALRTIYLVLEGTSIQAQHSNPSIHTTVNLTDILKSKNIQDRLSPDCIAYLSYLLNDSTSSENIRNNVAHRYQSSSFYSKERAQVLLHALLMICARYTQ